MNRLDKQIFSTRKGWEVIETENFRLTHAHAKT